MNAGAHDLVGEMATWVSSLAPWKVFATHTFFWEASLWSCRRVYERFMREALPALSYFYAIEQNPCRDGHHVHAMWDSLGAPRKATHKEWLKRYGRNRIEPVREFGDVVNYCAKYVCKEGAWWDFHLSRSRYGAVCSAVPPERPAGEAILQRGFLMGEAIGEPCACKPARAPGAGTSQ